ncbi:MAG: peptidase M16, partial [Eggerthellaceae bacterium]|nr:peptidase M16 [Eggerthellaceae bacterium]
VIFAMASMAGWLYDDDAPTMFVRFEDDYATLRSKLGTGYFGQLASEIFLHNDHCASVELVPIEQTSPTAEEERIACIAKTMSADDARTIAETERALREAQESIDSPEALATLPHLGVADLAQSPELPSWDLDNSTPLPCIRHSVPTRGIAYAYRYYDLSCVAFEDLPYVNILTSVLGKLDTVRHTAAQIDTLVQGKLGNLGFMRSVIDNEENASNFAPKLVVAASALESQCNYLVTLPHEIMFETDFSNTRKIFDILVQKRAIMERGFASSGHSAALARLNSYYLPSSVVREQLGGIDFYRTLKSIIEHFDEYAEELPSRLARLAMQVFSPNNLTLAFTGSDESFANYWSACEANRGLTDPQDTSPRLFVPEPVIRNEAFVVPADVVFVTSGHNLRRIQAAQGEACAPLPSYRGAWQVASKALNFEYLWNEVRVKGGAYGVGFQAGRLGGVQFHSYRDPHIDETLRRFRGAPKWLRTAQPSTDDLEGYIVSTVAGLDAPHKVRDLICRQDVEFFSNRPKNALRVTRADALEASQSAFEELACAAERALDEQAVCVFGGRDIIGRQNTQLEIIDLLGI